MRTIIGPRNQGLSHTGGDVDARELLKEVLGLGEEPERVRE